MTAFLVIPSNNSEYAIGRRQSGCSVASWTGPPVHVAVHWCTSSIIEIGGPRPKRLALAKIRHGHNGHHQKILCSIFCALKQWINFLLGLYTLGRPCPCSRHGLTWHRVNHKWQ
jgi:hypothetical protein